MHGLVKFLYLVSLLFATVSLFFAYYQLGEFVIVGIDPDTLLEVMISKHYIFYFFGGILLLANLLFVIVASLIPSIPLSAFPIPNKSFWLSSVEHLEEGHAFCITWVRSWVGLCNGIVFASLTFLWLYNIWEAGTLIIYNLILQYLLLSLLLWWIWIPIRFSVKRLV